MSLSHAMQALRRSGRKAFIPYITAGDPSLEATERFAKALIAAGADALELGVPFSDPVADGPTNQKAAERALRAGTSLAAVLELVARLRRQGVTTPIVLFTYFNPIFKLGEAEFARRAQAAGVSGTLVVDLPPEEAAEFSGLARRHGLDSVFLASPTTTPDRFDRIAGASSGFIYYVSRTGVTGVRTDVSSTLGEELARFRGRTELPIAVGFGISTPEQARQVASLADGIVVGSAFVKIIEESPDIDAAESRISTLARSLAGAIQKP
jgi:tryptophan synthase alpha chain